MPHNSFLKDLHQGTPRSTILLNCSQCNSSTSNQNRNNLGVHFCNHNNNSRKILTCSCGVLSVDAESLLGLATFFRHVCDSKQCSQDARVQNASQKHSELLVLLEKEQREKEKEQEEQKKRKEKENELPKTPLSLSLTPVPNIKEILPILEKLATSDSAINQENKEEKEVLQQAVNGGFISSSSFSRKQKHFQNIRLTTRGLKTIQAFSKDSSLVKQCLEKQKNAAVLLNTLPSTSSNQTGVADLLSRLNASSSSSSSSPASLLLGNSNNNNSSSSAASILIESQKQNQQNDLHTGSDDSIEARLTALVDDDDDDDDDDRDEEESERNKTKHNSNQSSTKRSASVTSAAEILNAAESMFRKESSDLSFNLDSYSSATSSTKSEGLSNFKKVSKMKPNGDHFIIISFSQSTNLSDREIENLRKMIALKNSLRISSLPDSSPTPSHLGCGYKLRVVSGDEDEDDKSKKIVLGPFEGEKAAREEVVEWLSKSRLYRNWFPFKSAKFTVTNNRQGLFEKDDKK